MITGQVPKPLARAAVLLLSCLTLSAQTTPRPPDRPLVKVETEAVLIDFIARDSRDRPVDDLRIEEIRVFEDGRERPVRSLQLVRRGEGAAPASRRPGEAEFIEATRLIPIVFVLDLNALDGATLQASKEAIREFLALHFSPRDRAALAVVDDSLTIRHPFDGDVPALLNALDAVSSPRGILSYGFLLKQLTETYRSHSCADCNPLQEAIPQTREFFRGLTARSRILAEALSGLGRYLEDLPGRKHIVLLTAGYRFRNHGILVDLLDAASRSHPPSRAMMMGRSLSLRSILAAKLGSFDEDSFDKLGQAARDCNSAQASIYSVDARGLTTSSEGTSDLWELSPGSVSTATFSRILAGESSAPQEFLRMSSEMTGGRTYLNRNDLAGGALQAQRDASSYYVVAYEPDRKKSRSKKADRKRRRPTDRYRRVRLEADRSGLKLRHRQGYFERPTPKPEERLLTALRFPALYLDFAVEWRVSTSSGLEVEARIATGGLDCPQTDGQWRCQLELYGVLVDEKGHWAGGDYAFVRRFPLELDAAGWEKLKGMATVSAQATAQPPAGKYELIGIVRQAFSNRLSAFRQEVIIPQGPASAADR